MKETLSLDDLWSSTQPGARLFDPAQVSGLPERVRLYLEHAIAAGTPLASAVQLRMHGEIKLKEWHPFTAEQVILWNRGMIWRATVHMFGMPICGGDFHHVHCGGSVEEEDTFAGYTIPTRMRVEWHFGTDGFEQAGSLFNTYLSADRQAGEPKKLSGKICVLDVFPGLELAESYFTGSAGDLSESTVIFSCT